MNKSLTTLLVMLLITGSLFGQQFKAGLLAGVVTSQVDGDTYAGYNKAGLFGGASVSKRFSAESKWSALFEITYIQKGSRKVPHPEKGDYSDYKLKLNYAEVPLLIRYDFAYSDSSGADRMNFGLLGGVAVGALVSSAEWDAFGQLTGGTPFEKTDISYVLGLSYSLSEHIGFEARTQYSIIPVRKGGTSTYYANWTSNIFKPGYYNNLLVFALHYRF
jgi:hypothetical protein